MDAPDGGAAQTRALGLLHGSAAAVLLQLPVQVLNLPGGQLVELDLPDVGDGMQLDAPPVVLRRGEPQVGFGVDLKPQPQPLGHRVFSSPGHVQAAGLPNGLLQLRLDLGLGSAQYVLDDPLAGIRVVSGGVPALPAAIAALANISLTIGPLFGHVVRLPCSNTTYSRKEKISRANQQS